MLNQRARALKTLMARVAIASVLSLIPAVVSAAPAHAAVFWEGSCWVNVTLTFSSTIGTYPISTGYQISGSSSSDCISSPSGQRVSFGSSSITAGYATASCDAIETLSGFDVPFRFTGSPTPPPQHTTLVSAAGPTTAQDWVFPGVNPYQFDATASLAWLDTPAISTCHSTGVNSMSLVGLLTYEDPTLP